MSVLAVIFFGLCVTSVWAECGPCDRETQCSEEPAESDCEFGVVQDACHCCLQCARGLGQTCGVGRNAAAGICAPGLLCRLVSPRQPSRCDEDPRANKDVAVQELPAVVIHEDSVLTEETPLEEEPTLPIALLTPNRNQSQVPTENRTSSSRQSVPRNPEHRPFRHQLAQENRNHNTRTPEIQSEGEADTPAQELTETVKEEPVVPAEETEAPADRAQERPTSNTSVQSIIQRVRGNGVTQNGRTRGEVPLQREPSSTTTPSSTTPSTTTSTTEAPVVEETESHQEQREKEVTDSPVQIQEEQGQTNNTSDDIVAEQDSEVSRRENQEVEEVQKSHTPEEATSVHIDVEAATHSHNAEEREQSHTDDVVPHSHSHDKVVPHSHSHDEVVPHTHSHDELVPHTHSGDERVPHFHSHDGLGPHTHSHDGLGQHTHSDDEIAPHFHSHDGLAPHTHSDDEILPLSHSHDEVADHTQAEVEEPERVAPVSQSQDSESQSSQNNNHDDQNRSRGSSVLGRRNRRQKEPTPKHDHEGSIKNLNAEDKNENYNHDSPDFDNRTN